MQDERLITGTWHSITAYVQMMLTLSLTLGGCTAHAWTLNPMGWFVTSDSRGNISPSNAVASVSQIASAVASAEAAALKADVNAGIANSISNEVDKIAVIINSLEGVGYIDGYVLSFEGAVSVDTNATSKIVAFGQTDYSPAAAGSAYYKLNTWVSSDIDGTPVVRTCTTLGRTNNWSAATVVSNYTESVLAHVNGTDQIVDTYAQIVQVPNAYTSSFFRVFSTLLGHGGSTLFNVNNGFSVNGKPGLTMTFSAGTNTVTFVGGIRVED